MQTRLQPVDEFVFHGLSQKMQQSFQATSVYQTSPDKLKALQTVLNGKTPEYPFVFLNVQTWRAASDRYHSRRLATEGLPVRLTGDNGQVELARVVPTNFEVEVSFVTNAYDSRDQRIMSVKDFARRWLFCRRNGALNFTVNYGMTNFPVTCVLGESTTMPSRETPVDAEPVYTATATLTVQGYTSEPVLAQRGRIRDIILSEEVPPIAPGATFYPFREVP